MTITLTNDKKEKIKRLCKQLQTLRKICKRELASVIGNIVTTFRAVPYDHLYYTSLGNNKLETIKISKFNLDTYLTLSDSLISELS